MKFHGIRWTPFSGVALRNSSPVTVFGVLRQLCQTPGELLVRKWNWKSAVFSSLIRAGIFFFCNLTAGLHAAEGAMLAELVYRGVTSGFYGALTQAFRQAVPVWKASAAVMVLLPLSSHSIEFAVHLARHTPHLRSSIISSVCFTCISTLFNLYAMRRGVLVTGPGGGSVGSDLRRIPGLIAGFVAAGPLALYRSLTNPQPTSLGTGG
jgi:hypothetical protein